MIRSESERRALLRELAPAYARVALENIEREFPSAIIYMASAPGPAPAPRRLHPAFFGSYDWHSCVEMHWVLVRLLRLVPEAVPTATIRAALDDHLSPEKLAGEEGFFDQPGQETIERPYGWGWLLALAHEADLLGDADGRRWAGNLAGLTGRFSERLAAWLPRLTYPVRYGAHYNTAFGLTLARPFALAQAAAGDATLRAAIDEAARRLFAADADYPAAWEPSGGDFLSPALTEAELMARLLGDSFSDWLGWLLPGLARAEPANLFQPVTVSDSRDGHTGHLHGLNLSRAWCWLRLAESLPAGDPRIPPMLDAAERHAKAALPFVVGSDYVIEHWLAVYAVLLLSLDA